MALLPLTIAIALLVRTLIYVAARLNADPATRDMVGMATVPLDLLKAALGGRNKAENEEKIAQAERDYAADAFADALVPFGQRVAACYGGSRTAAGYLRIFPLAPSEIGATAQKDQVAVFARVMEELLDEETPKELAPHVKALVALHKAFLAAHENDLQKQKVLAKAVVEIGKARNACLDGVAQVQGELSKRYPRNRKKVNRYFPVVARRAPTKADPAPVVEPVEEKDAETVG